MNKNIIVFGSTNEKAVVQLKKVLNSKMQNSKESVESFDFDSIILYDKDLYIALSLNDDLRYFNWQYAYIDHSFSDKILSCVILPRFIPKSKDGLIDFSGNAKIEDHYERFI